MADFLKIYNSKTLPGYFNSVPLEIFSPPKPTYSKKLVRPFTDKNLLQKNKAQSYILSCFTFAIIAQEFFQASYATPKTSPRVLDWLSTAYFFSLQTIFYICRYKSLEISTLINGLIQFENTYPKKRKRCLDLTKVEIFSYLMVYTITYTQYAVPPTFVFGLYWKNPRQPSVLGYWLIPAVTQANTEFHCGSTGLIIKVGVLVFNCWIILLGIHPPCFLVTSIFSLSNLSIYSSISKLETDSVFADTQAKIWRHIQVLVQLLNDVQKGPPILVILTCTSFIFALATTTLVRYNSSDWTFLAILFAIMCYTGGFLLTMCGVMAAVYIRSLEVRQKLSRRNACEKNLEGKWKSRFLRSCFPFKNFFGSGKFVDECTPIIIIDNLMVLSANLLLLQK